MMMMKRQLVFIFLVFFFKHKVTYATNWPTQRYTALDEILQGFTFDSFKVNTIFECYRKCEETILCSSINMNLMDKTCELNYSTKTRHPEKKARKHNSAYIEVRDDFTQGSKPDLPIASCKKLKEDYSQAKSGVYWMKFNEPSSAPFQVFCDMITDGGGWTLVYSYTFTQFNQFNDGSNAMTPMPNWPMDTSFGTWVPQSTTTPLSESSRSAMDFALWKKIGIEFLIKPNITNWVACVEGTGSLVNWVTGTIACRVVKAITTNCTTLVPNLFNIQGAPYFNSCVSGLLYKSLYVYIFFNFDGRTDECWPVHDPCGAQSSLNHLTNVPNPGGAMYIR